jgi:hypothetical protein
MGIDYEGSMIVGEKISNLNLEEDVDIVEWIEENGLDFMSPWFDSDAVYWTVGFRIGSVDVGDIVGDWLIDVQYKAAEFFKLTGVKAKLIGEINIT